MNNQIPSKHHEITDEIEKSLKSKTEDQCEKFECNNKRQYIVTITYGRAEENKEKLYLCQECMEEQKKDARRWAYGFSAELIPGTVIVEKAKKRGRPKN